MPKPFHDLLQLTDPHFMADPAGRLKDVHTRSSFAHVLEAALADSPPPAAILLTGDVTQDGSRDGYLAIHEALAATGVSVWCLPGNHDDPSIMAEVLGAAPFHYCEPLRLGQWLLPMVGTWDGDRGGGRVGEEGLATLDRLLAAATGLHALVCLHHQPTPIGCGWLDGVGLDDRDDLMAVIDRHPHVRGLLWGHVHQEMDEQRDGRRLMSTPSTCFQFLPRQDEFGLDPRPPGYRRLRLHDDGRIETTVQRVGVPAS